LNRESGLEKEIERNDLMWPAVISGLLDPYALKSVYSLVVEYLIGGTVIFETPFLLRTGRTTFLPFYSFEPAAGVPRHCLTGYLTWQDHLFRGCLHTGAFGMFSDYGVQMAIFGFSLDRGAISFDLDLRYWHSNGFLYHDEEEMVRSAGEHGGLAGGRLYFRLPTDPGRKRSWFLSTGISLKTAGYTRGYPLNGGLSFSAGVACMMGRPGKVPLMERSL
jgi:hypothetical protein